MATLKVITRSYSELTKRSNDHKDYERYTNDKTNLVSVANGVDQNHMFESMRAVQEVHHNFRSDFFISEHIQSFSPDVSTPGAEHTFHQIGRDYVKKMYPEHQSVVITHTDKRHFHNHIFINPVHPESGKRLGKGDFYALKLRRVNDQLQRSYGLPVVSERRIRPAKLHYKSFKAMVRDKGAVPDNYDLIRKLDVARSVARSMDEFRSVLGVFGIGVRQTKNSISYSYPGKKKRVRGGRSLGANYTASAIEEGIAKNNASSALRSSHYESQIIQIQSLKSPESKSVDLSFVKFADQSGHQSIRKEVDFVRNVPKKQLQFRVFKAAQSASKKQIIDEKKRRLENLVRDESIDRKSINAVQEIVDEKKEKDPSRDFDLGIDI